MSYLSQPTSTLDYGVVKIGNYVDVDDGVISLLQDVSPNASVVFDSVDSGDVYSNGNLVVTSVTPVAGAGIAISNLIPGGNQSSFELTNTGVLSLTAGAGITLTANVGNITISSYGADLINVRRVISNYTAAIDDEYIGVYSAVAITISLPIGESGRVYTIKDEYGQGSGKITIQPQIGELIDGKINYVIGVPYQSVSLVFRSTGWWII